MQSVAALEAEVKFQADVIERQRDHIDYLETQLMDKTVRFPVEWGLSHHQGRALRHLLKRNVATWDSLFAVLYGDMPGDEPDIQAIYMLFHHMRRSLKPLGIEITTVYGEGYSLSSDMKQRIHALCETDRKDAPV